jgi:hypothetical protein
MSLSASTGNWSAVGLPTYTYQWESCNPAGGECAPIEGATGFEYSLGEGDIGTTLRVTVTATGSAGTPSAISAATSEVVAEPPEELEAPSISGTPSADEVLHATDGIWTGTDTELSNQWESCNPSGEDCAPIEGATSSEYDLGEGDVGTTIRVRVGAHSASGSITDASPVTPVVGEDGALASTSPPEVSGAAEEGQKLYAGRGGWSNIGGSEPSGQVKASTTKFMSSTTQAVVCWRQATT